MLESFNCSASHSFWHGCSSPNRSRKKIKKTPNKGGRSGGRPEPLQHVPECNDEQILYPYPFRVAGRTRVATGTKAPAFRQKGQRPSRNRLEKQYRRHPWRTAAPHTGVEKFNDLERLRRSGPHHRPQPRAARALLMTGIARCEVPPLHRARMAGLTTCQVRMGTFVRVTKSPPRKN